MTSKLLKSLRSELNDKIDLICVGDTACHIEVEDIHPLDKGILLKLINNKLNKINNKKK